MKDFIINPTDVEYDKHLLKAYFIKCYCQNCMEDMTIMMKKGVKRPEEVICPECEVMTKI